MRGLDAVSGRKEEQDACEKIESQRMHITHAMPGEKLVREFPRANQEQGDRCKKLRVPIQKFVEQIGNNVPEGAPIIDCRLAAFRAPMALQFRSAILTVRNRWALSFAPAEKPPAARLRLFDCGDCRIPQDKFFQFIGHTSARLRNPLCGVYALIQGVTSKGTARCASRQQRWFVSSQSLH